MFNNTNNNLIQILEKEFSDVKFKIIKTDNYIDILYDKKEYKFDDNFFNKVFNICENNLDKEDLWKLSIIYDYLGEIK